MHSTDLLDYIRSHIPFIYYPNSFPPSATDDCGIVRITGGPKPGRGITKPTFQVMIRATHTRTAEEKAWEVLDFFNLKRDFDVGLTHVIVCNAQTSTPLYIGEDENGRFLYSVNFSTISEVL